MTPPDPKTLSQILGAIRKGRTFFLSGHQNPDGDTVGSELAFASLLRRLGKKADIYNHDPLPRNLLFLPGACRVRTASRLAKKYDVAVVFECSGGERMGNIIDLKTQAKVVINIDHHAHHNYYGRINLINPKASSNSEQLYYLFEKAGLALTAREAAALYVGLVTDTGRFQQENTTPESHYVAAKLLEAGAPVADINRRLFATFPESTLKLLGRALDSLVLRLGGRVAVITLTRRDFSLARAKREETENIINYGLTLPTVEVAALLRQEERGRIKVSLRGKGRVDLCRLAVSCGGGGHRNASGYSVRGSLRAVARHLLANLKKVV